MNAYPLKFKPIIKDKIWGGHKLQTVLGKDLGDLPNGGESWELSAVKGSATVVANGEYAGLSLSDLTRECGPDLVGHHVWQTCGDEFPLLIKFIDAADNLSVQVHPDDQTAREHNMGRGKTEMWYVLSSEPGGKLISGFRRAQDEKNYESLLASGHLLDELKTINVSEGDVVYVPAGRIHAIGKGVMVAEIQQTSDTTYRVWDYDRRDAQGHRRELHIDEARRALHFADTDSGLCHYQTPTEGSTNVVDCPCFSTNVVTTSGIMERDYSKLDSFVILVCVEGSVKVGEQSLRCGETMLIPACMNGTKFEASEVSKLLEISIPLPS